MAKIPHLVTEEKSKGKTQKSKRRGIEATHAFSLNHRVMLFYRIKKKKKKQFF